MGLFTNKIFKNVVVAGVGITVGGVIGYYKNSKLDNAQIPIKKVDLSKLLDNLEKDLAKTYRHELWNKVCMVSQNKVVQGAVIGLGTSLVTYNAIPYIGATILNATPQILTYIKKPEHFLDMERLKEIVKIRQDMRIKTAMHIVNDPELSHSDIIVMFQKRFAAVKAMVNGSAKNRALFTLISILTFVILTNVPAFAPLIQILRDLVKDANLNEETPLEFTTIHQNKTLHDIIIHLVKKENNSNFDF